MHLNIIISLILALFAFFGNAADSDGKDLYLHLLMISIFTVKQRAFKYTKNSDNQQFSFLREVFFNTTNQILLDYNEVLLSTSYSNQTFNHYTVQDFHSFNAWGHHFLIPSTKNAGNKYIFPLPSSYLWSKGSIAILPFLQDDTINVNIAGYLDGLLVSNETIQYSPRVGDKQHYISVGPYININNDNHNTTIVITADYPIMLSFATFYDTTGTLDGKSCGRSCNWNYVTFMPMPSVSKSCNSAWTHPDQRMITNDFTTRLYVSPPNVENTYKSEMASSTSHGQMAMYRYGSILKHPDSLTAYGHFVHYVPSVREWVSGRTQFYTLAKDCYLEFYTNQEGSNTDFIKVDGKVLSTYKYTLKKMNYFKTVYGHFLMSLKGYGLHTFENSGYWI
uniref:Thermopsin n=1 Tax=Rhabditophanes sp. KR3021 TaxID=114890 RepID=A0AC35TSK5_9BILA